MSDLTITIKGSSWARVTQERDMARDMVHGLRKQRAIARKFGEQMERERDEAREAFAIATNNCVDAQQSLRQARDRAWKLACERSRWKLDCLEQCKLLAMSADREEKLLQQIASLKSQVSNLQFS